MATKNPPKSKKKAGAPLAQAVNSQNKAKANHKIVKGIINQDGPMKRKDFLSGLPSQTIFSSGDNWFLI